MSGAENRSSAAKWLLPCAAVLLICLTVQLLYARRYNDVRELVPVNGVLDITGEDLSDEVVNIANSWEYYPNKLYGPEDFSGDTEAPAETVDPARYGTYRLTIKAKPDKYYTICAYSVDYATQVYVNGVEAASYGRVADNAVDSVAGVGYMTIPMYTGESGTVEIICQFSNFVHRDGGFIQPTYMSEPQKMEDYKAAENLVSLCLSGGMLALFLYFLLCATVRRSSEFAFLSVCCLLMALRDQNFLFIHFLPPSTPWELSYRLLISVSALLPGMVILLLCSLFPGLVKRKFKLMHGAAMALAELLICFMPTMELVRVCTAAWICAVPLAAWLVVCAVRYFVKRGRLGALDVFSIAGSAVLLFSTVLEGLLVNSSSFMSRYGIAPAGMLAFALLTAVSISLRAQEQKLALAESRNRSMMLERMNAMNLDFLRQVAHELKTPLTVISGYAQLTGLQLSSGTSDGEAEENLRVISFEAQRLADMVSRLMEHTYGRDSGAELGKVDVAELLESAAAICAPVCLKNNNSVSVADAGKGATAYGNRETLLQVFINLAANANRHMSGGALELSASDSEAEGFVLFRVSDTGDGINESELPRLFEKGYSGDGGSGLGLSICRDAVEAQGGRLYLEKTGPGGTTFVFTVPRG